MISGFTGSAGTAVVTEDKALLWTDGRYFLQASKELSEDWTLMKAGLPETPTVSSWLGSNIGKGCRVGIDPMLHSISDGSSLFAALRAKDVELVLLDKPNPVDVVWGEDQPAAPCEPMRVQPVELAGKSAEDKIAEMREAMAKKEAGVLVVSALDEIAWLFNVRGSDIDCNPVAMAYAIITPTDVRVYVDSAKLDKSPGVREHLQRVATVKGYLDVFADLEGLVRDEGVKGKVWMDPAIANLALFRAAGGALGDKDAISKAFVQDMSPVQLPKALKTKEEIEGMRQAHIRDGVALMKWFAWLEASLKAGEEGHTEYTVSQKLAWFRSQQEKFVSLSFDSIAGSGPNGAVIHYHPMEATAAPVTLDRMLLVDSGGQYEDGTTDVTRTVHFGEPSEFEKRAFTRVLQGHIMLGSAVFPHGTKGSFLDSFARQALWKDGLDYRHGTGHGVGAFLNVHEGPCSISPRENRYKGGLKPGMILSNEPGYYHEGEFGIRIESLVVVEERDTPHRFGEKPFCGFETITVIPIQSSLCDPALMSDEEIAWLNNYNAWCVKIAEPLLADDEVALEWMRRQAAPLSRD
jgi:Xaa-Pro aminopeptidase